MGISAFVDAIDPLTAIRLQNGTIFDGLQPLNEQFLEN
jgi:hypothetical protein